MCLQQGEVLTRFIQQGTAFHNHWGEKNVLLEKVPRRKSVCVVFKPKQTSVNIYILARTWITWGWWAGGYVPKQVFLLQPLLHTVCLFRRCVLLVKQQFINSVEFGFMLPSYREVCIRVGIFDHQTLSILLRQLIKFSLTWYSIGRRRSTSYAVMTFQRAGGLVCTLSTKQSTENVIYHAPLGSLEEFCCSKKANCFFQKHRLLFKNISFFI